MSKRPTHSPEFKAKVAMAPISGCKTIHEIAADHGMDLLYAANLSVRPIQASQWKKQLFESASELFARGEKTEAKAESQAKEEELFLQIGKLQMEPEWLKKISAAVMPVNFAGLSVQTTLSSASTASTSFWFCPDPPITPGPLHAGNRLWASWRG
jgi:transposase-like protein